MYKPSFTQVGQIPKEEFEKECFPVFAILRKNFQGKSGRGHRKVIQLYSANLGILFECATYGVGVIGKNTLA